MNESIISAANNNSNNEPTQHKNNYKKVASGGKQDRKQRKGGAANPNQSTTMSHLPDHILILNIQNNYNSAGATPSASSPAAAQAPFSEKVGSDRGGDST